MHRFQAIPQLVSVKVIVEERRIDMELDPGNWRTHEYKGFSALPDRLRPAFASPGTRAEIDLIALIHEASASGNVETRFELPYQDGAGQSKRTVLRTVVVHLYYGRTARAPVRPRRSRSGSLAMPLLHQNVWPVHEVQQVERELARNWSKLSPPVLSLVVRLAKLEVEPSAGRKRLLTHSESLLHRRSPPRPR